MAEPTLEELRAAYRKGLARAAAARARGGQNKYGWNPSPALRVHVDGMSAVSEFTVARATGRRWISDGLVPDAPAAGDVDGGLMVRWTALDHGSLIIYAHEPDHLPAVLVVGALPPLRIVGYRLCGDCKDARWWRPDRRFPAFFVPQRFLEEITPLIRAEG